MSLLDQILPIAWKDLGSDSIEMCQVIEFFEFTQKFTNSTQSLILKHKKLLETSDLNY